MEDTGRLKVWGGDEGTGMRSYSSISMRLLGALSLIGLMGGCGTIVNTDSTPLLDGVPSAASGGALFGGDSRAGSDPSGFAGGDGVPAPGLPSDGGGPPGGTVGDGSGSGDIQSGTLTAGSFDDNLNLDVFLDFLADFVSEAAEVQFPVPEVGERVIVRVVNSDGGPVNDAEVLITAGAEWSEQADVLLDTPTGSDGQTVFVTGIDGAADANAFTVSVLPPEGGDPVRVAKTLEDERPWEITLAGSSSLLPTQLDLAFVIDATGSMSDELEYLKVEVEGIVEAIGEQFPEVDQRYGLVVYRDEGDAYVTKAFDFVDTLDDFAASLGEQRAGGGGDYPEAMHLALEDAVDLSWRTTNTARVLFLIADAPPHVEFATRTLEAVQALREAGVAIFPVAASGVASEAELIMRTAALLTLSEYIFLTDDSGVGNPHAEPHIPCYVVQRLDQVMTRMIASELSGQKIWPLPDEIIRTVGNPVDGVCQGETEQQAEGQ